MRALCFSAPVQRRYYAGSGSLPHVVSVALLLVVVFVPLFLAHGSRGFWPKTNSYDEQPRVKLTYQVVVELEGERFLANGSRQYFRVIPNSLPSRVQRLLQEDSRASQIKAYEVDSNRNGLPDVLRVIVTSPLRKGEAVFQVKAFIFLNYTLSSHVRMNMDAMAVLTHASPLPGASLRVDGDLVLSMRTPARVMQKTQEPFLATPILNTSQITAAKDLDVNAMLSAYRHREWHTQFVVHNPMWTTVVAPLATPITRQSFQLDVTIRIPPAAVLYRPTWAELLKTAWIQYFSVLVVIYGISHGVSSALFKNRVLDTYSVLDDPMILTKKQL